MITLIDLAPWVARLIAQCPIFEGRVFLTIPDADLAIDRKLSPVAFVYLSGDQSDDKRLGRDSVRQKNTAEVTVEIAVRRSASATDLFSEADAVTIRNGRIEVFNALIGWQPPGCLERISHKSGTLKSKDNKTIKWSDDFETKLLITTE